MALVALTLLGGCDNTETPHVIPCPGSRETAGEYHPSKCAPGCLPSAHVAKNVALVVCLPVGSP